MNYAEVSDVEARWRDLTTDEQSRCETLLGDASAMLDALVPSTEGKEDLLCAVCCDMVIRAMSASGADAFGASSVSMAAGPYSQTWSYANPSGDMYLTKLEKRLLGITGGYIGSIQARIGENDD